MPPDSWQIYKKVIFGDGHDCGIFRDMQPRFSKINKTISTPWGKIIAISILLVLLSGIAGAIIYWNQIKQVFIRDKVKEKVADKTDNLYAVRFDDLQMDEVGGNLTVTNLQLDFDSARYEKLKTQQKAPPVLFRIHIPQLLIRNVQTPRALIDKEIKGGRLEINNPKIEILYTHQGEDSSKRVPDTEVYKQILGDLNLIHLDTLLITGARVKTRNIGSSRQQLQVDNLWVQLRNIAIDSAANQDSTRIMFAQSFELQCPVFTWRTAEKLYDMQLDSLRLTSEEKKLTAKSFKVIPLLGELAFAEKMKVQADRFDIALNRIVLSELEFQNLFSERIEAKHLLVGNASVKIYRDNSREPDGKNRIGTYPHQRLMQVPLPINIRQFDLKNTYVEYKEKGRIVEKTGKVIFSNLNASFKNVTNNKQLIKQNNLMTAKIQAKFLQKFPIDTDWTFYLANPKGRFDVKGHTGAMDGATINKLAEPLGGARIEKGRVNSLDFNFKADDYKTDGTVKFLYEDLKISILKRDEETDTLKKKKLVSLGANIIIKKANPGRNDKVRLAEFTYARDTTRSMFNMAWKALREGLKETVLP